MEGQPARAGIGGGKNYDFAAADSQRRRICRAGSWLWIVLRIGADDPACDSYGSVRYDLAVRLNDGGPIGRNGARNREVHHFPAHLVPGDAPCGDLAARDAPCGDVAARDKPVGNVASGPGHFVPPTDKWWQMLCAG